MTFQTSWGISFHEYLVPLFSVRVSLRTRRASPVEPEWTSSGRPRGFVSGRNSSGSWSHQGRRTRLASIQSNRPALIRSNPNGPHLALIRATPTGPHPDKPTWPDPDKPTWPDPGKFKQTPAYSSKLRTNTSEPSKHKQTQATPAYSRNPRQTHANSSIFTQTKANSRKHRQTHAKLQHIQA